MSYREIAEYFGVGEATVRLGCGVFARLRRVALSDKCVRVPRADFDRLVRLMERRAVALDEPEEQSKERDLRAA
jgi:transposase